MRATFCGVSATGPPRAAAPTKMRAVFSAMSVAARTDPVRRAAGDEAVALEQDQARRTIFRRDELIGLFMNFLRENRAGIDIGHEHRLRAAADDLVRETALVGKAMAGLIPGAEDLVDRDGMGVADDIDARQRQQVGVEDRLDRGLGLGGIDARIEQRFFHFGIGHGSCA